MNPAFLYRLNKFLKVHSDISNCVPFASSGRSKYQVVVLNLVYNLIHMLQKYFVYTLTAFYFFLWVQSALPKFYNFSKFREVLDTQAIPKWSISFITWAVPITELSTAILLIIPHYRTLGFYISTFLMFIFTFYIGGIKYGLYKIYPCNCGAMFKNIGWKEHFWINVLLTVIAIIGIIFTRYRLV